VDFTTEALEEMDRILDSNSRDSEDGVMDEVNEDEELPRVMFTRTHRRSDGVIAGISDDVSGIDTEEVVPKQALEPLMVIKGFMI